ncbi:MAG: 2-oxoglutarate and iron-dependent oxygenase domain-containing protein [Actinomycetota bacterium]
MDVPIIDIAGWRTDPENDARLAAAVDSVCRTVGFFKVGGHGVDTALIERLIEVTDGFFAQSEETKLAYVTPPEIDRGYTPPGREALAYSLGVDTPPDLFEAFNIGVGELLGVDASEGVLWADNLWPDAPSELRPVWLEYCRAMYDLADRLLGIFAVALDLPPDWLQARSDRSPDVFRALNYERHPGSPDPVEGQLRMGPHSDYGTCTILLADPVPGLQILGLDGDWHDVTPTPGTFLVNIGDLLAAWTNDRWRSTLHRVLPPPVGVDGPARRRSFAYFHEANPEVIVEPLPGCVTDGPDAVLYEPFSVGDHLTGKVVGPRTLTASVATTTVGDRADHLAVGTAPSPTTDEAGP